MKQEIRWFDRKFAFDHLKGTFPSIYERLEGLIIRLTYKLESIPPSHLYVKLDGKWSIKEHVGHLIDLESLWSTRMLNFLEKAETLAEADLENGKTHSANHNNTSLEDLLATLSTERAELLSSCRKISAQAESLTSLHPRLMQPMRAIDLAYFIAEHDDHHLAAITEINNKLFLSNEDQ